MGAIWTVGRWRTKLELSHTCSSQKCGGISPESMTRSSIGISFFSTTSSPELQSLRLELKADFLYFSSVCSKSVNSFLLMLRESMASCSGSSTIGCTFSRQLCTSRVPVKLSFRYELKMMLMGESFTPFYLVLAGSYQNQRCTHSGFPERLRGQAGSQRLMCCSLRSLGGWASAGGCECEWGLKLLGGAERLWVGGSSGRVGALSRGSGLGLGWLFRHPMG